MNRYIPTLLLSLVIVAGLTYKFWPYISKPTLVVRFDGKPIKDAEIVLPTGLSFDEFGKVVSPHPGKNDFVIVVKSPDGCYSISFPNHGTKTVDICEDITYTTLNQLFGVYEEKSKSIEFSDVDAERLLNDKATFQEH